MKPLQFYSVYKLYFGSSQCICFSAAQVVPRPVVEFKPHDLCSRVDYL